MKAINQLHQPIGFAIPPHFLIQRFNSTKLWLLLLLMVFINGRLSAFSKESYSDASDNLWPMIETQLDQSGQDTSLRFIFLLVRGHCGQNYNCLYPAYAVVREKLERLFNLPAAIEVCKEMVTIAHRHSDLGSEADAYLNIFRFYQALGDDRQAAMSIEKAEQLYEQVGDRQSINKIRMIKLEAKLSQHGLDEVLFELEGLLAEIIEMGDTANGNLLNLRLIHYTQQAGDFQLMAKHVAAAEKVLVANPHQQKDYWFAIHTILGRADLCRINQDLAEAERFYQKALGLCMEMPDLWLEVKTLQLLTEVEWERGNVDQAKTYLDRAQKKAEELKSDDLLTYNFELKARIAEEEKQFGDALAFTKKKLFHEEQLENKNAGFDAKNFYLQKEKEQLAAEKEKQELELRFKDARLRNLIIIIALALLLITALALAFINLRKAKDKLAAQNTLIQQQTEALKSLDAAKSRFFANVSHELRTPLSLVIGPISTLVKENKLNERQAELLRIASESGQQLEQLVTEILDLGKLEMGKMQLDQKPTNLWFFFQKYLLQFESLAYQKQVDFSYEINLEQTLVAEIDQAKCRQVLYNLLSNAFKFTPTGGQIKADLSFKNNRLHLNVADSGQGIHPDDLPLLFDRYFQTTQTDRPAAGGSGIGLALCHEYALLFGGKIEVDSKIGEGSVFRFEFPVSSVHNSQSAIGSLPVLPQVSVSKEKNSAVANTHRTQKPTVLVVEDNLELQRYIRLVLEEKYNVITAENGQVALEVLSSTAFSSTVGDNKNETDCQTAELKTVDLILSDLMMPEMDGYQLLEKLKSDDATRHIPVIMLTARADVKGKLKALRLGVDDYLLKPFEEEELLARIENLLKNYAVRQRSTKMVDMAHQLLPAASSNPSKIDTEERLLPSSSTELPMERPILTAADNEWLAQLEENLQTELTKFDFKLENLAELMLVSRRQLGRQLKALTGLTPSEYLLEARLQHARQLLDENEVRTVKEAAYSVGLRDAKHFSKQFKERFGKFPSDVLVSFA